MGAKGEAIPSTWVLGWLLLTGLTHYVPSYLDCGLTFMLIIHNVNIANQARFIFPSAIARSHAVGHHTVFLCSVHIPPCQLNWKLPLWFWFVLVAQAIHLRSGFATDHDPFDGEWGGPSEDNEWF